MLRKAFIGAALAFLCLLPVSSDDVRIITLEEAIRSAAEHNLDIEYAKTELSSTLRIQDNVMSTFMPDGCCRTRNPYPAPVCKQKKCSGGGKTSMNFQPPPANIPRS